jgi:RNA-directed DNA polymerase
VRYADDFVIVFDDEEDARRVMEVLPKRLARFGLEVSPKKTQLVRFGRPKSEADLPEAFDFLGFTFYWGKSTKGSMVVRWKTAKKRVAHTLWNLWQYCRDNRHEPIRTQHATLGRKLQGHYQYFGLTMNMRSLAEVYDRARSIWRYWLGRRSQKGHMTWERFLRLEKRMRLPRPRVVHSVFQTA